MSDRYSPAEVMTSVMVLASHAGFAFRVNGVYVTEKDVQSLFEGDTETFLEFATTDGDLTFSYTQSVSDILVDPTLTLQRLGKLSALLVDFSFGE